MQLSAVAELLSQCGGKLVSDRDGDVWRFTSGEFVIDIEPFQSKQKWGFDCSLEHRSFSTLANHISGDRPTNFVCIKWFQRIQADDESPRTTVEKLLEAACSFSIDEYISIVRSQIPDKSVPQVCHLASLAREKDFLTLMDYQDSFRTGNRKGFVPIITSQMIERALNIALEDA